MNHEGYRDDTPEKAIWGIRKEERIREIEKKHGVYRGEYYHVLAERVTSDYKSTRTVREYRKMKVIGVYPHIITLEDKNGVKESFQWEEFFRKRKSEG